MEIIKETAPHLRKKQSVTSMMCDVLIALAPTLVFAFVIYPLETLYFLLISLAVMIGCEFIYIGLRNMYPKDGEKRSFKEKFIHAYKGTFTVNNILTPAISAVIFTLIMPAGAPLYAVFIGSFVGIVFGKLVFGGLGNNIFNPACVGMIFAKLCFGSQYQTYVPTWYYSMNDVTASATPLGLINSYNLVNYNEYSMFNLFFGQIPGTLGEVYKITILIGLAYLLIRRAIDWRIVVSYFGTFTVLILIVGLTMLARVPNFEVFKFVGYSLFSGGLLFGGTFMLTDPVTSPIDAPSRVFYGCIAGILTVFIRIFAGLPEGVGFSILLVNMLAPLLDYPSWSSQKFTKKKVIVICSILVLAMLACFLIIYFKEGL